MQSWTRVRWRRVELGLTPVNDSKAGCVKWNEGDFNEWRIWKERAAVNSEWNMNCLGCRVCLLCRGESYQGRGHAPKSWTDVDWLFAQVCLVTAPIRPPSHPSKKMISSVNGVGGYQTRLNSRPSPFHQRPIPEPGNPDLFYLYIRNPRETLSPIMSRSAIQHAVQFTGADTVMKAPRITV